MKIGVVADTHSHKLPQQMLDDFKEVDFIIHAGDICSLSVLNALEKISEIKAVYGNMDDSQVREHLPQRQIIKCQKFSIGVFHGRGAPHSLMKTVMKEFKDMHVDAIIFGHSHHPVNKVINKILYFNPGSPTDTIFAPYQSYGILEINDKLVGHIIKVRS